jgi:hypothetical protein
MDGYAYYAVTSVEELRHYAEEAGKSKEDVLKITEPKKELRYTATGVMLVE